MPHQISISATTGTPPYQVIVCDVTLVYCYSLTGSTSLSATTTFEIPAPLDVADSIIIKIIDSNGCQKFLLYSCPIAPYDCAILTELSEFILTEDELFLIDDSCPPITPTPSATPTSNCRCIQITNTGNTVGTFYYTQCNGNVSSVLPINSGTTLYYCGSNPVALTECYVVISDPCVNNSCVAITPTPTPTPTITPSPSSP